MLRISTLCFVTVFMPITIWICNANGQTFTIIPEEYSGALRNPMKGFRPLTEDVLHADKRYATISHSYFRWNELEDDEDDTVEKIRDLCDLRWFGVEAKGIKIIPSIYLDFNEDEKYWPSDMVQGDYVSPQFKRRLKRLISRLGECWDKDPRVAFIETSIIGLWGEQHSPSPSPEIQKLMGDAFARAFPNKKCLVRHPNEFTEYEVGYSWGSWAHGAQINDDEHGAGIDRVNRQTGRWKTHPIEGEIAYNWGTKEETLGGSPDKTLTMARHRKTLVDSIHRLHCTGLGWVAQYDQNDPEVAAGAQTVQKAFGYRFVIKKFSCFRRAEPGEELRFQFEVVNTGSAPFYSNWPVVFSLLDPKDGSLVWRTPLKHVDIRDWIGGDDWDSELEAYRVPAKTYTLDASVGIPQALPKGQYIGALSIVDPAGHQPALRFAIQNYFPGGRHPLGIVGIGIDVDGGHEVDSTLFLDPMEESRRGYKEASFPKRTGFISIPSVFDDESAPGNQWVIGTNKTTLNAIADKSWVRYSEFDFRQATRRFAVRAASGSQGGRIELRIDSLTGPIIGSIGIPGTGDWNEFRSFETELETPVSGVHDLYLQFSDESKHGDYLIDIESFKFHER